MDPSQIQSKLQEVPGWRVDGAELVREFKFKDFAEAFAYMTLVAVIAEQLHHHPDWTNVYNRVIIRLTTHETGGLSDLDFELAKRCNKLLKTGA